MKRKEVISWPDVSLLFPTVNDSSRYLIFSWSCCILSPCKYCNWFPPEKAKNLCCASLYFMKFCNFSELPLTLLQLSVLSELPYVWYTEDCQLLHTRNYVFFFHVISKSVSAAFTTTVLFSVFFLSHWTILPSLFCTYLPPAKYLFHLFSLRHINSVFFSQWILFGYFLTIFLDFWPL